MIYAAMDTPTTAYAGLAETPEYPWFEKALAEFYKNHREVKKITQQQWRDLSNNWIIENNKMKPINNKTLLVLANSVRMK